MSEMLLKEAERHLAARRYEDAHALCIKALEASPDDGRAFFLLGVLAADHGNAAKAIQLLERAVALAPHEARHHAHLGRALTSLSRQDEARAAADRAAKLEPRDALTFDTIGVVYSRTGRHDLAIGFFEEAARRDLANASFRYNLAASQQFVGDFHAAAANYREALKQDPGLYRAWSALVSLQRQTAQANHIAALEAQFSTDDPDRALHIGHALAKTYEDLGDYPRSLEWLLQAKAPKRARVRYSPDADAAVFAAAAQTLGPASGDPSERPIFVVGLPRTGTTLVERILSSHPAVTTVGELSNFALIVKRRAGTPSPLAMEPKTLLAARDLDHLAVGRAYIESVEPLAGEAPRFVDKMPLNVLYAGLIHRALPNARIVCLRRHPMDAALSNFRQLFATAFSYYDYNLGLQETANYVVLFERLVERWRQGLPADRFLEVAYEDLVADQEGQTRKLLDFCGLEFDPKTLAFHENPAPVATASSVQVRQPLYSGSVGRWKRYGEGLEPMMRVFEAAGLGLGVRENVE